MECCHYSGVWKLTSRMNAMAASPLFPPRVPGESWRLHICHELPAVIVAQTYGLRIVRRNITCPHFVDVSYWLTRDDA
ncbi:hypothetical protein E2C01_074803 [Portunus trituberculatus]|uniref:Uncharacterized protein n=1 Tax=Portunus trituberculatus TaxID=210409 RepID=A0A5B7IEG2_PORTR|nr:hypothetical protein [Portunus trituberculatus]